MDEASGCKPCWAFIEWVYTSVKDHICDSFPPSSHRYAVGIDLPDYVAENPVIEVLGQYTNDLVTWSNVSVHLNLDKYSENSCHWSRTSSLITSNSLMEIPTTWSWSWWSITIIVSRVPLTTSDSSALIQLTILNATKGLFLHGGLKSTKWSLLIYRVSKIGLLGKFEDR